MDCSTTGSNTSNNSLVTVNKKVYLKLYISKVDCLREMQAYDQNLNDQFVVNVLATRPESILSLETVPVISHATFRPPLTKQAVEKFPMMVFPYYDRSLFVSLKLENIAGKVNLSLIEMFTRLVKCVEHIHSKGLIHTNIKPLNFVRHDGVWKLTNLESARLLGIEKVDAGCVKSSSYVPPEIFQLLCSIENMANNESLATSTETIIEKSKDTIEAEANTSATLPPSIVAHSSYDVWSLGCILFQLANSNVSISCNVNPVAILMLILTVTWYDNSYTGCSTISIYDFGR
jgi:serine/threonine protein kinase